MKSYRLIGVLLVVIACVVLAGAAFANKGSRSHRLAPHHARAHAHAVAPSAKPALAPSKGATSAGDPADPDNVQSGDQRTPDQPGEQSSESENATDSETGQQGEPAQGHEDPPGDVNHECTGNCQE
jgi:hypothetical protein